MKVTVNGPHESGRVERGGNGEEDNEDYSGHAIAQVGRCWFLTMVPEVQSHVTPCKVHGRQHGTGAIFSPSFFGVPLLIVVLPLLCIHQLLLTPWPSSKLLYFWSLS